MLLWCLLSASASAQAEPLTVGSETYGVETTGYLSVFHDQDGTMTPEEALAAADRFHSIPSNFNAGYSPKGAWWLRLDLRAAPGGEGAWYLAMNAPYTDSIQTYAPDVAPDGTVRTVLKRSGALLPLETRDLITHTVVTRIVLEANKDTVVLLRFSGRRSLSAMPVLWRLPAFVQHLTINVLLISVALGAAGIAAVGALIFGLWLRSPPFAWYGAYVGSTALVFLGNSGFLALILSSVQPTTVLRLQGMIGCLSIMTGAFMIRSIFCPPDRLRLVSKAVFAFGMAAGASIIASAAGQYGVVAPFLMAGVLALAGTVPVLAAMGLRRGDAASIWYFVGFTSYSIATFWFALVVFGIAPLNWFLEWGHQTVGLLHMVAIFGGLASALQAGARERRDLQGRLLAASRQNEAALEGAVAQRTAALKAEIEARRQAEAALRVALREQRNFLVMVSHEFRTPLATVRAAIAIIERGSMGMSEKLQREAGKIVRAVERLSSLIDTFLAEEWINKIAMRMESVPVDMGTLTADICREQAAQSERAVKVGGLAYTMIDGDPVLLRTVIENLVANAIKYSDGDVRVDVRADKDGVALSVADSGAGIPPEEQQAIFERYYRSATASSRPGAGIGLHMVKRVVEMHQGSIAVSSAPGAGSVFEVWLPRTRTGASEAELLEPASGA